MDGMEILGNRQGMQGSGATAGSAANSQGVRADRLGWIKELVRAEQRMEESGVIEFGPTFDPAQILLTESVAFMNELKVIFVDAASAFNQLKGSSLGRVKIYGIANTHADFMLFRNGFKLIFALKEPGAVSVRFHYVGAGFQPAGAAVTPGGGAVATHVGEEDLLIARWGAFGDLNWTYQEQAIKTDYLVRYYLTRFVRESAK
jgi:hypothetical protein